MKAKVNNKPLAKAIELPPHLIPVEYREENNPLSYSSCLLVFLTGERKEQKMKKDLILNYINNVLGVMYPEDLKPKPKE